MRELMEKIAGRIVEDLYADPTSGESIAGFRTSLWRLEATKI